MHDISPASKCSSALDAYLILQGFPRTRPHCTDSLRKTQLLGLCVCVRMRAIKERTACVHVVISSYNYGNGLLKTL